MSDAPLRRLAAIDWMRGFVMILMTIDHASQMWNGGRRSEDSAYLFDPSAGVPVWVPGSEIETAQFFTRWITHLCAPTFLFLSGTSLALSLEKRRREGASESSLDRHLLVRALVILGFEGFLSLLAAQGVLVLQVLYAIGASMLAMIVLRRLPMVALLLLGLGWLVGSEYVLMNLLPIGPEPRPLWATFFFVPVYASPVTVIYPMTHWLAMMLIGWAFGRYLLDLPDNEWGAQQTEKLLLLSGLTAMLLWSYIRMKNGYGNMGLLRDDTTIIQWLHMSKYPPALVYSLMELGLMALGLVFCLRLERGLKKPANQNNPFLLYGQTALFFYMLHFILLAGSAIAITGGVMQRGLGETYVAAGLTLLMLYPVCRGFRTLKRKYPKSVLQYI